MKMGDGRYMGLEVVEPWFSHGAIWATDHGPDETRRRLPGRLVVSCYKYLGQMEIGS